MIIQNKRTKEEKDLHLLLIPKKNYVNYVDFFQKADDVEIKDFFEALVAIYQKYNLDAYPEKFPRIANESFLYINHNKGVFNKVRGIHSYQYIYHLHLHIQYRYIFKNNFLKEL